MCFIDNTWAGVRVEEANRKGRGGVRSGLCRIGAAGTGWFCPHRAELGLQGQDQRKPPDMHYERWMHSRYRGQCPSEVNWAHWALQHLAASEGSRPGSGWV